MGSKYAGSEILQMAIEIEQKGKLFYENMADSINDLKVKKLFRFLAEEEVQHEIVFKKMLSSIETFTESSVFDQHELHLYFRSFVGDNVIPSKNQEKELLNDLGNINSALDKAFNLEKAAILYFHELKNLTNEKDSIIIDDIIREERIHIKKIFEIMEEYK